MTLDYIIQYVILNSSFRLMLTRYCYSKAEFSTISSIRVPFSTSIVLKYEIKYTLVLWKKLRLHLSKRNKNICWVGQSVYKQWSGKLRIDWFSIKMAIPVKCTGTTPKTSAELSGWTNTWGTYLHFVRLCLPLVVDKITPGLTKGSNYL